VDVLITIVQIFALAVMGVGINLIDDVGLQIFLTGALVLALAIMIEARRSA
jgi:hypothetical protein